MKYILLSVLFISCKITSKSLFGLSNFTHCIYSGASALSLRPQNTTQRALKEKLKDVMSEYGFSSILAMSNSFVDADDDDDDLCPGHEDRYLVSNAAFLA